MGGLRVSTVSEKTVGLVSIAQDAGSPVLLAASAPLSPDCFVWRYSGDSISFI